MAFDIAQNVSAAPAPCTLEALKQAMCAAEGPCAEIADLWEKELRGELAKEDYDTLKSGMKKKLPVLMPHASFTHHKRKSGDAQPSGMCMLDIDHIAAPSEYYMNNIAGKEKELGIVLAHITPSLEGLRLIFIIPESIYVEAYSLGETPDSRELPIAQLWLAQKIGIKKYDDICKDYARCSFIVPQDYVIYADYPLLFADHPLPEFGNGSKKFAEEQPLFEGDKTYKGIPYSNIITEYWRLNGGEPVRGERNDKLYRLCLAMRYICDDNPQLMLSIMPRYGLDEQEMKSLITSALRADRRSLSKIMRQAIVNAQRLVSPEEDNLPPEMPKSLPSLVSLLLSKTPKIYQPAVAHAIFPSLAAHLCNTKFRYIDNVAHEATLMNVLMAGTGAGKDCVTRPISYIMADIRQRDAVNLEREKEWKAQVNASRQTKDKPRRPEGLVIQEVDPDMTNPAFVMRMAEAKGHFLYTHLNEIEQFNALRGVGNGANQQFQIMCLAFDPSNRYGQTRVGTSSVTEKVTIRFNWNATTTIAKGKKYFNKVVTDGPISRINFCTIPEREIGAEMPVYGVYEDDYANQLQPYIDRLVSANGLIDIPPATKLAKKMVKECADHACLTQSREYENLSFRAAVIAWLKACVLYVAEGNWSKKIENFAMWSLRYDLWCKMQFFGAAIQEANSVTQSYRSDNLLSLLPATFTLQDAIRIREMKGKNRQGTTNMLNQWIHRRYIRRDGDNYIRLRNE